MFLIKGSYNGQTETIDEADTREDALYLLGEYRLAFGQGWRLWIKPEPEAMTDVNR
ncbi:MAG: hypothetical protein ACYSW0_18660 [Planctomycetota bacterium]|jgi:hypothetical protein